MAPDNALDSPPARDDVIERLETELHGMTERAIRAEAERDGYSIVARAGIHHAHDLHVLTERQRETIDRLRDENRQLRAAMMQEQKAA